MAVMGRVLIAGCFYAWRYSWLLHHWTNPAKIPETLFVATVNIAENLISEPVQEEQQLPTGTAPEFVIPIQPCKVSFFSFMLFLFSF